MRTLHHSAWRCAALALCILAASCATRRDEGRYVAFVRDVMAESARLQAATAANRSEQALNAVTLWRVGATAAPPSASVGGDGP